MSDENNEAAAVAEVIREGRKFGEMIQGSRTAGSFDALASTTLDLLRTLVSLPGEALAAGNEVAQARIKAWKLENLWAVAQKVDERIPLDTPMSSALPFKTSLALAEAASEEDDSDLQDLWADLIVGLYKGHAIDRFIIDVVHKLDTPSAKALEVVANGGSPSGPFEDDPHIGRCLALGLVESYQENNTSNMLSERESLQMWGSRDVRERYPSTGYAKYRLTAVGRVLARALGWW